MYSCEDDTIYGPNYIKEQEKIDKILDKALTPIEKQNLKKMSEQDGIAFIKNKMIQLGIY